MDDFNIQPHISGSLYSLRPLHIEDFDGLFEVAGDELLWAGHPSKNRYQQTEFEKWFEASLASESALVMIDNQTEKIIGSSRFYKAPSAPNDISIGYTFLARDYWGGTTNAEIKRLMIDYAAHWFDTIWFHISPSNIRSQKATLKIGAEFSHDELINLGSSEELWKCYKMKISR